MKRTFNANEALTLITAIVMNGNLAYIDLTPEENQHVNYLTDLATRVGFSKRHSIAHAIYHLAQGTLSEKVLDLNKLGFAQEAKPEQL